MKRLGRETWFVIGLFVLLLLVTVFAAIQQTRAAGRDRAPTLSSTSSGPNGARALWLWLDGLGYPVSSEVSSGFRFPDATHMILMLAPSQEITADEWGRIDDWVEDGGTLILSGDDWGTLLAVRHYDFDLKFLRQEVVSLTVQTPLLASPPPTAPINVRAWAYLQVERPADYVTHLAAGDKPVLVSFEQGAGQVFLSAAPFSFSNAGLKEEGNAELVLNLLAGIDKTGLIWFDEWHHGVRPRGATIVGPWQWLRYTSAGQALLYTAAVFFLALVLQGRRLGRPVPLAKHIARRAPLEYVTAIANLSRRAKHRQAVLQDYHHRLKRELGRRYRLNPTLPDKEYVELLSTYNPDLDTAALLDLLTQLRLAQVNESGMILLAAQAAQWLEELR